MACLWWQTQGFQPDLCQVGHRAGEQAAMIAGNMPLISVRQLTELSRQAIATSLESRQTRSNGQNPVVCATAFVAEGSFWDRILRSAHVRQRVASSGALGDCASHFGLTSIKTSLALLRGLMSVTSMPNFSPTARGTPRRFSCRAASVMSASLREDRRPSGSSTSRWFTSCNSEKRGAMRRDCCS
ncbi:hypothetical protein FH972_024294 [Carpinus fangiana]|uniref:Uncharacterized protein n=1 Tax=Carpinus fangiana TaxID=176857 RepID=A0A5N6L054_9ROSI|nr:hypothetical protein FH972_024294 [Carpinus fangiana]